jgi:hypothetical protein
LSPRDFNSIMLFKALNATSLNRVWNSRVSKRIGGLLS